MLLITIGTKSNNRLVLDKTKDPRFQYISGYHAELLLMQDGSIYLTDKSSMNSTKVNGKRVEPEVEVSVRRGDRITLADVYELDWNAIPTIPVIDPKRWDVYSVGSDYRNRIKVTDSSGAVSRFHATLKVDRKTGKVYLTDHSTNGTFVNGVKVPRELETVVGWNQRVTFASIPLDWHQLKRPVNTAKELLKAVAFVAVLFVIGLGVWQREAVTGLFQHQNVRNTEQAQRATVLTYHRYYYEVTLLQGIRQFGNVLKSVCIRKP